MIRSRIILLVLSLTTLVGYSQSSYNCLSVDSSGLYSKAFSSFEKDLFEYYNFGNDSIKTYRTFLAEVASLSIDLRKLPSDNSIQVARLFKQKSSDRNSIWVKLSDYENHETAKKETPAASASKNEEEILIFNYRGGLIQCLKNNSNSDDFRNIVSTLEQDGNVSTSLIAQKIYYIPDNKFKGTEIKKFIAFDIYYSILMVIEKAFG